MAKKHKPGSIDFNDVPTLGTEEIIQRTEGMQLRPTVEKPKPLKLQTEETMGLAGTLDISLGEAEEMQRFVSADDNSRFLQRVRSFLGPFPVPEAPGLRYTAGQISDYFKYGLYKQDVPAALEALPGDIAAGFLSMGKFPSQMRQMMAELLPEEPTQPIYPLGIEEPTPAELSEKAKATNAKIDAFIDVAFPTDDAIDWNMTPLAKLTQISARGGLPSMSVAMGVSILTGNPWPGLLILGAVETGGAYERQRIYGETPGRAALKAFASGGVEIATEVIPFDFMLKGNIIAGMATEALQEKLAGLGQNYIDEYTRLTLQEGMEPAEASKQAVAFARKQSDEDALVGATMGLLGAGVVRAGRAITKKPEKGVPPTKEVPAEPTPAEPAPTAEKPDLTTMGWRDLQQVARDHGLNAFQARDALTKQIVEKEAIDAIPITERLGAMGWKELQQAARAVGINAFQKRSKVIEDILRETGMADLRMDMREWIKLSPEEKDRISREGLAREEMQPAFGEEREALAPEEPAAPTSERAIDGFLLQYGEYTSEELAEKTLEEKRKLAESIWRRMPKKPREEMKLLPIEEPAVPPTAEAEAWVVEAKEYLTSVAIEYDDAITVKDILLELDVYHDILNEIAVEQGASGLAALSEIEDLIRRGELSTGQRVTVPPPTKGIFLTRRTQGELETQIGILDDLIEDLEGLVKQFPDNPTYQNALEKAQQEKEQLNTEIVEGMLEEAGTPTEAATNIVAYIAELELEAEGLEAQLELDPGDEAIQKRLTEISDELAMMNVMEETLERGERKPPTPPEKPPAPPAAAEPTPEPAPEGRLAPPTQEELDEANKALSAQLTKVEKIRKQVVVPAVKKMRKQQIAKAMAIEQAVIGEGASAADVIRRSKGGYKVDVDIPTMSPLELSPTQWDAYSRQVYSVYPGPEFKFQQTTAQGALDKLRTGHVLTDSELALLIPVMGAEAVEDIQKMQERTATEAEKAQRKWNLLRDIVLFWKSPFNYDLQFVRNAMNFLPRHPVKYTKATMKALKAYADRDYARNLIDAVKEDPEYEDASAYLNFLETGELAPLRLLPEQYRGRLPSRLAKLGARRGPYVWAATMPIRGIGRAQLAAERSFVASANWFMLELWKQRSKQWEPSLQLLETGELSLEERQRIEDTVEKHKRNHADVINTYMKILRAKSATGRAIQTAANFVLWSPSMTYSRFKRPKLLLTATGSRGYAMQLEAANIAKIYLVMMAMTAIGNYFRDDDDQLEPEMNPMSSNWGKFKQGDTWFDLGGGETQHYRTLAQFIVGEVKTQSGRTVEIPRWDIAKKYAQGRETALIGVIQELLTGETVFGQKVWEAPDLEALQAEGTVTAEIYAEAWRKASGLPAGEVAFLTGRFLSEHLMPAALVSFAEAAVMDGWPQAAAAGVTEFMALSAQSYKARANAELNLLQDALAEATYKKKWEALTPDQQKTIRRLEPILAEKQVEVRKEQQRWATQPFERREEKEVEEKLFNALTKPVQKELEKLGLTAGSVSRRWGSVAAPYYLNEIRFERYVELTQVHVSKALDRLFGRPSYKKLLLPEKEASVRMAIAEAKTAARIELEKLINANKI